MTEEKTLPAQAKARWGDIIEVYKIVGKSALYRTPNSEGSCPLEDIEWVKAEKTLRSVESQEQKGRL